MTVTYIAFETELYTTQEGNTKVVYM